MRVLVTGAGGQVGAEAVRALQGRAAVVAHDRTTLDLSIPGDIVSRIREARPAVIVNAAAYTAVDKAESEPQLARAVNGVAPGIIAAEAKALGALLIHFSTDYVFDGTKRTPYLEDDGDRPTRRLWHHEARGRARGDGSRLRPRDAAHRVGLWPRRQELHAHDDAARGQGRTDPRRERPAWRAHDELADRSRVVVQLLGGNHDRRFIHRAREGASTRHLSRDRLAGETTWHGFATAIFQERARRSQGFTAPQVIPITTADTPTPAKRPGLFGAVERQAARDFRHSPGRLARGPRRGASQSSPPADPAGDFVSVKRRSPGTFRASSRRYPACCACRAAW